MKMKTWLDNRGVGSKLASIILLLVGGIVLIAALALSVSYGQMSEERRAQIRAVVDVAVGHAETAKAEVAAGRITREQAIQRFLTDLGTVRYANGSGYYFAYSSDTGFYVANPSKPASIGTDGKLVSDPKGRFFIRDSLDMLRRDGAGFFELEYPRPGSTVPVRKLNYVKVVPDWNIAVASGLYIDDVDAALWHEAEMLGLLALPVLLLCAAASLLVRRSIVGGLRPLVAAMKALAAGDTTIDVTGVTRRDEVGDMAKALQIFKETTIRSGELEQDAQRERQGAERERHRTDSERAEAAEHQTQVVDGIAEGLSELAEGTLTFRLQQAFPPAYDKLRLDFNAAMATLQDVMGTVGANVGALHAGSREITSAADDLSRRTEQQAASLEETAAALDEITATVRKTAEGALHARAVVTTAKGDAETSGQVVGRAVEAMSGIATSSRQIGQIIGVIDEIAFQTNLLALNAGVEAARAGDAGRGFAVVASEVRALAQRSADAAKEIKALISTSAVHVDQGVDLVAEAGRSLERIVRHVTEINGVVADIAASAQEQATALAEVNTAINQMDQVTQQNAAMVEQSTAASHTLSQESEKLTALVGRFKTGSGAKAEPRTVVEGTFRAARPSHAPGARARSGGAARKLQPIPADATENWDEF